MVPAGYVVPAGTSWANLYEGPPEPEPVGSPHWRTPKVGWLTSRWHGLPSKNFCWARYVKLAVAHGALVLSSVSVMSPWFVLMSRVDVPCVGVASGLGGVPTSLR